MQIKNVIFLFPKFLTIQQGIFSVKIVENPLVSKIFLLLWQRYFSHIAETYIKYIILF